MASEHSIKLSEDELDDLLYFARTGETDELVSLLSSLEERLSTKAVIIIESAQDEYSHNNLIHMAAGNGHTETTTKLLSYLPPPSAPDAPPHPVISHQNESGNTPLHWACLNGHLEVVKVLVNGANADPTITNKAGHDSVYEAELNDKADVVDWLLKECGSLEDVIAGTQDGDEEEEETEKPESADSKSADDVKIESLEIKD